MTGTQTEEMALLSLLTFLLAVNSALSARIAGFCAIGGSQYINMRHTMEELASRGHEVEKHYHLCMLFVSERTVMWSGGTIVNFVLLVWANS